MKTLTSIAMAALMVAATTVTADPMRDGEPVLEGKLDHFDCEQTLRTLIEYEGLSQNLKSEYAKSRNGYLIITADFEWYHYDEKCVVEWYREADIYSTLTYLREVRSDARNWEEVDFQTRKGAKTILEELGEHLKTGPDDVILEPVLKHTNNVEIRLMTMYSSFHHRQKAPGVVNRYHSSNF